MACGRVASPTVRRRLGGMRRSIGLVFLLAAVFAARAAVAAPVTAGVAATVSGGYARLVFSLSQYDKATVRKEGNVLVIGFAKPIDVSVERLATQATGYIGAARRDPDGRAVRLALAQAVTFHTMSADRKVFVDLLPDSWRGPPPGLPADVIEDLERQARQVEELAATNRVMTKLLQRAPTLRVRVASEPTFTRYIFSVPQAVSVAADQGKGRLTLGFDAPLRFDLSDAVAALPREVAGITAQMHDHSALVVFKLRGKVDLRTFRDEHGYAVDVVTPNHGSAPVAVLSDGVLRIASPAVLPSVTSPVSAPPPPAAAQPAAAPAAPAVPAAPAAKKSAAATPAPQAAAAPAASPKPAPPAAPAPKAAPSPVAAAEPAPAKSAVKEAAAKPSPPVVTANGKVPIELSRQGNDLTLTVDFLKPVAAAVFNSADTLWMVFDSRADLDLGALKNEATHTIRSAKLTRAPDGDILRVKLDRPRLASVTASGSAWTVTIGDTIGQPTHALDLVRDLIGPHRASVVIPMEKPHALHRVADPETGDQLLVVTAFAPARGLIHTQNFIDFRALASQQGVAIEPLADDIQMALEPDRVVIGRPGGLTLSSSLRRLLSGGAQPLTFDSQLWGFDRKGSYFRRESQLIAAAAAAPKNKRLQPRLALARFYLARSMYAEAAGVLDVVLADAWPGADNVTAKVLRAVAEIMMDRPADALKDLDDPAVGDQDDAPLWRALADARQGKWAKARAGFKRAETSIATLPIELQRVALRYDMRASIEVKDYADAENELDQLKIVGIPHHMQPAMSVLVGRLDQGLGHTGSALAAYRAAAVSWDRPAAAQGRLREILLRYSLGDLKRKDVVSDLESLTTVWRGDETEIEALRVLARLYTEEGRYRDSFYVMRSAMEAHPNWAMTQQIEDEAAKTFDSLFLAGKGDSLSAIDALSLFYDFRELTPIGSRGDEMIRRLADRLVSVDLLDQAAGLLQYQVDKRLQGAARAEVATRLAVIYLMDRKPAKAVEVLRATRTADLSTTLRDQRLLLQARALSDIGQHDLALEVIADVKGRVAIRLRSDIYWAAHKWDKAAEQIELMYGDRWKQWRPLNDVERSDILRAEIGYALAGDKLGLDRFRNEYAAKMANTPDARDFAIVSAPLGTGGEDFQAIARAAAAADTLDDFLYDMKARYPETNPIASASMAAAAKNKAPAPASPPQTRAAAPPTPAIAPTRPTASAAQTAMR
jgi:tetratricopeptide (TPR) repeat protein